MDQIEAFLETLLENSPAQYRSIAQKALDIYRGWGQLTVKLKNWALRAAKVQRVAVPEAFHELPAFEPRTSTYAPEDTPTQPEACVQSAGSSSRSDEREVIGGHDGGDGAAADRRRGGPTSSLKETRSSSHSCGAGSCSRRS
jgi:hypothetical protein